MTFVMIYKAQKRTKRGWDANFPTKKGTWFNCCFKHEIFSSVTLRVLLDWFSIINFLNGKKKQKEEPGYLELSFVILKVKRKKRIYFGSWKDFTFSSTVKTWSWRTLNKKSKHASWVTELHFLTLEVSFCSEVSKCLTFFFSYRHYHLYPRFTNYRHTTA